MNSIFYRLKRKILKMFCSKLAYMFWEDNESLRSHVGNYYTRTCKVVGEFSAPCLIMMVDGRSHMVVWRIDCVDVLICISLQKKGVWILEFIGNLLLIFMNT